MKPQLHGSIVPTLQRALVVVLAFVVMGTLSGCGSINPSVLLDDGDEAKVTDDATNEGSGEDGTDAGNGEASPATPPAWANVDLRDSNPEQEFTQSLKVFYAVEEDQPFQGAYHEVGSISDTGVLSLNTAVEMPSGMLSTFVNEMLAFSPSNVTVTPDLTFTPAGSPNILMVPLNDLWAVETPDATDRYRLSNLPEEQSLDSLVYLAYSDRAVAVTGVVLAQHFSITLYRFNLELESGLNVVRAVFREVGYAQEEGNDVVIVSLGSNLQGDTIDWNFYPDEQ